MPYDLFITFSYDGTDIKVDGQTATNAIIKGKLIVNILHGKADNPKVNAIVLVEGSKYDTHFAFHERYLI